MDQSSSTFVTFADERVDVPDNNETKSNVWKVVVVDDEEMVHTMTRMVLSNFLFEEIPVQLYHAYSGQEAKTLMENQPDMAVMLLDVVMEEDHSGLEVVHFVRKVLGNDTVRIVLRTGQPGQAPESKVIMEYDINDYREKTDLTVQKLNTTLVTALRGYRDIKKLKESEKALKIAMEKVVEASKIKTQFMANMSHEIRTPLNGIAVTVDLLKTTALSDEQLEYVNLLSTSTDRLMPIVNDILDLSKIETGNLQLEEKWFSFREIIESVIEENKQFASEKNLEIILECDERIPNRVVGDFGRLRQVLSNLINNSIKFTYNGHVLIRCVIESEQKERIYLTIEVEDTGVGIPEDELTQVFRPFVQGSSAIQAGRAGTGLGLAIAKSLVEMMGGNIAVKSHPDRGATFSFGVSFKTIKE